MYSRNLFFVFTVLGFVAACVLLTFALRRSVLAHADRSLEAPPTPTSDTQTFTPYGRLVWWTMNWLDRHEIPFNRFARTIVNRLVLAVIDGDRYALDSVEQQSHSQNLGLPAPSGVQRPPLAHR
ncbi:hypothetical protein M407DRAFT_33155 [Tulasnella calospora MUT 4182]|uniref:Uncharacterized protein n=1 Tax=Tulasnella calospora MUT 4182 TaxID=1051891 RepID=A0A0C3L6L3_9AGAM|nr:hypothetical protein M407DRAFT_33155 [Tulasnella calospora MUT 4182]